MLDFLLFNATKVCGEAVNQTGFDAVHSILMSPALLVPLIAYIVVPMFFFLMVGLFTGTRNKPTIARPNFWLLFFLTFVVQAIFLLFMIFPVYYTLLS